MGFAISSVRKWRRQAWFPGVICVAALVLSRIANAEQQPAEAELPADAPAVAEVPGAEEQSSPDKRSDSSDEKSASDKKEQKKKAQPPAPVRREAGGFDIVPGPLGPASRSGNRLAEVRSTVRTAQVHFKVGMSDLGNVRALDAAMKRLDEASEKLQRVEPSDKTMSGEMQAASHTIEHLRREVRAARADALTKLAGRFPLIRGFGLDLSDDEDLAVHSYPLPDVARREATLLALTRLVKTASSDPLQVLLLLPGQNAAERDASEFANLADAQAHLACSSAPHLTLCPGALRATVDAMPAWDAPDAAFDPICRQFLKAVDRDKDPHGVMVVMLREFTDEASDSYWVQAQHRTYGIKGLHDAEESPEDLEADRVRIAEGLAHDKSRLTPFLLTGIAALFATALLVHAVVLRRLSPYLTGSMAHLGVPTAGFLIGLVVAPLVIFALGQTLPDAQTDALLHAWWPCSAGALSLILPAGVFRLAAGSVGRYVPAASCHGRWGISFVPVALGTTVGWLWAACYAFGPDCIPLVIAIAFASALLVYCFGRAIDVADAFPTGLSPIVLILGLVFGGAAFLGSTFLVSVVAAMAVATSLCHRLLVKHEAAAAIQRDEPQVPGAGRGAVPRTLAELRSALETPLYQPPRQFEALRAAFSKPGENGTLWIGLVGPISSGKTAAARHIIQELQSREKEIKVLVGQCTEDATPYQPFREALADVGVPAAFIAARMQGGGMTGMLDRLADEFIPFWDFFASSHHDEDDEDDEASRGELFTAVTNALHSLTQNHRIVLFLDDVQWIDEGSAALLQHIRENFSGPEDATPVILLAGREKDAMERLKLTDSTFAITPPPPPEQIRILEQSLGIERSSAKRLVEAMGALSLEAEGMFWLIRAVQELVTAGAFTVTSRGFALRKSQASLPVPAAMRARLAESIQESAEHRTVLECAALLGEEFRIDDLAECLEMDRLELLKVLRHLELDQKLVRDLPANQECYAFSSAFVLDIVREELGVGNGSSDRRPSKIARELHARIARVLERRSPRTPELIFRIARHYHRAGTACAEQSLEHCLVAARVARHKHQFREARRFVSMAEQSARRAKKTQNLMVERVLIDAAESRFSGQGVVQAAEALVTLLNRNVRMRRSDVNLAADLCHSAFCESGDPRWKERADQWSAYATTGE